MHGKLEKYLFENDNNRPYQIFTRHLPAGETFPPHWHDFLELEIITSGSLNHNYNNAHYTLQPGNAHIISYYDFHALTTTSDVTLYCIHFNKKFLAPSLAEYLSRNSVICQFTPDELEDVIKQIDSVLSNDQSDFAFQDLFAQNILSLIIIKMIKKKTNPDTTDSSLPMQQAVAYIADNFLQKLTLYDVANAISFSPGYLGKLFKKEIGIGFNDYLQTLRLKYACNLLSTSSAPVQNIAFQSGFSSVEYFTYVFKKIMNMTPNEYRALFLHVPRKF